MLKYCQEKYCEIGVNAIELKPNTRYARRYPEQQPVDGDTGRLTTNILLPDF